MIAALAYLQFHSVKNRLITRFKRLKQPKYLVGAIVGGLYFYFYFFRFLLFRGGRMSMPSPVATAIPTDPLLYESIGALILFGIVLLAWVLPHKRAALTFTEAEVAFLFPAPVSRKTLIHFKLARAQLAIFFMALFFTLVSSRFGGNGRWLIRAGGWWTILFTLNLHFLASSFTITKLMDSGLSTWKRRVAVLGLFALAAGVVIGWAMHSIPELTKADIANFSTLYDYFKQVMVSGPIQYLLFPFRLVVRPYLATDCAAFALAVGPAVLLMLAHYFWVIRSDVAFEEASVEASKKLADKVAAMRSGQWRGGEKKLKKKRPPFELRARGWPLVALFWKNLINAGSAFTARTWISIAVVMLVFAFVSRGPMGTSNWTVFLGMFTMMVALWTLLAGPQIMRQDFRQDLPQMDMLKVFPLRGWQVALGQLLAPATILTGIHWLLLIVGVACAMPMAHGKISGAMVVSLGLGAAMLLPGLNLISLVIPNAAVLWFPAWFQAGKDGPAGIEATGQRILFAICQLLAYLMVLIPAALAIAGVLIVAQYFIGVTLAIPLAAFVGAVVLVTEAALGVMLLGWLFDRFDLSKESTN